MNRKYQITILATLLTLLVIVSSFSIIGETVGGLNNNAGATCAIRALNQNVEFVANEGLTKTKNYPLNTNKYKKYVE